jgi:uncharacterized protein (UPF0261 family)
MIEGTFEETISSKPIVAISMLGNTTPVVDMTRKILEAAGYEVLVFHAVGSGGRAMESFIADDLIAGVLDLTTTELASELTGSPFSAGPDRLKAAGRSGIPQVLSVGCLDFSIFGRPETLPEKYRNRCLYAWNPETTLMRTSVEESARLGEVIVQRVNDARGPVIMLLPLGGFSQLDLPGQPFWMPDADQALVSSVRANLRAEVRLIEIETDINNQYCAEAATQALLGLMKNDNKPLPDIGRNRLQVNGTC